MVSYLLLFLAGAALANAVPHFVAGVQGRKFPTPFAKPPGRGLSSSRVNAAWGVTNMALGYGFAIWAGGINLGDWRQALALGIGVLAMGLILATRFGAVFSGPADS